MGDYRALRALEACYGEHVPAHDTFSTGVTSLASDHSSWSGLAAAPSGSEEYRQGRAEAERARLLGRAVRERRLALGLSQSEVAARAGMTQPALSRLEAGAVIPTIPVLERISAALDADLIVEFVPRADAEERT